MLSSVDLERLIAVKRREIATEKTLLGLTPDATTAEDKESVSVPSKQVQFSRPRSLSERNAPSSECKIAEESARDLEEIPADLERYIRRYLGLPVMLKAGEYSPNNPLVRGERCAGAGDALLGLGEYERRRNTLRKIRQRQYREYLDQQAKIKQEAKEKAERERREQEERERLLEERERERERESERERFSPERRRASVNSAIVSGANNAYTIKVDTAVQVTASRPLSVAVQTDEEDLFRLSTVSKNLLTQAERELSPRTVVDSRNDRPIHPASWALKEQWKDPGKEWKDPGKEWKDPDKNWSEPKVPNRDWKGQPRQEWNGPGKDWKELRKEMESAKDRTEAGTDLKDGERNERKQERRRSYGDFDERLKRPSHERVSAERAYKPSIFDADAVELRNIQAEKDAAERKQFYQRDLRNQILEQQRIREERKTREKMLEQAEMRRLEQQLRSLRTAHHHELDRQELIATKIKDDGIEYDAKRTTLQQDIDREHKSLVRATHCNANRASHRSKSDSYPSKLPFYYPKDTKTPDSERPPYSLNIPDTSVFSPSYDVESYLRRNLNPTKESLNSNRLDTNDKYSKEIAEKAYYMGKDDSRNVIIERPQIHEPPKHERKLDRPKGDYVALRPISDDRPKDYDRPKGYDRTSDYDYLKHYDRPKDHSHDYDHLKVYRPVDRPNVTEISNNEAEYERPKVYDRSKGYDRPKVTEISNNEASEYERPKVYDRSKGYDRPKVTEISNNEASEYERPKVYDRSKSYDRPKVTEISNNEAEYERPKVYDRPKGYDRPKVTEISNNEAEYERPKVYDRPKGYDRPKVTEISNKVENLDEICVLKDPLPIPVLRHSPKRRTVSEQGRSDMSEAMQLVDDKWKVPAVQKNILKRLPEEDGKSVSILTQLGSIRRQLQLEQLKLDQMLGKD